MDRQLRYVYEFDLFRLDSAERSFGATAQSSRFSPKFSTLQEEK